MQSFLPQHERDYDKSLNRCLVELETQLHIEQNSNYTATGITPQVLLTLVPHYSSIALVSDVCCRHILRSNLERPSFKITRKYDIRI